MALYGLFFLQRFATVIYNTFDLVHVKEQLMCACTDRQGRAGLVYAGGRGGAEIVTFDHKIGAQQYIQNWAILVVQNNKNVQ